MTGMNPYDEWVDQVDDILGRYTSAIVATTGDFHWSLMYINGHTPEEAVIELAEWTTDERLYADLDELL